VVGEKVWSNGRAIKKYVNVIANDIIYLTFSLVHFEIVGLEYPPLVLRLVSL